MGVEREEGIGGRVTNGKTFLLLLHKSDITQFLDMNPI